AGLEITLRAPELEALEDLVVAHVGADFSLAIEEDGSRQAFAPGRAATLPRGARLVGGFATRGARAWLAFGGGVDVPLVLGSRATETASAFGGFHGRPLAAGDEMLLGAPGAPPLDADYRDPVRLDADPLVLRVLPGPQLDLMPAGFRTAFEAATFS